MRRAWRALRRCVNSPSDVLLLARMTAWAPSLPVLKRTVPLPRLVRLMASRPRQRPRDTALEQRIARMARLLYRGKLGTLQNNCLERSLLTYRFLGRAGADPELVVGARQGEEALDEDEDRARDGFRGGDLQRSAGGAAGPLPGPERGTEAQQ